MSQHISVIADHQILYDHFPDFFLFAHYLSHPHLLQVQLQQSYVRHSAQSFSGKLQHLPLEQVVNPQDLPRLVSMF